jgi:hypothetical protein
VGGGGGAFSCGGDVCELPDIPNADASLCCATGDRCGVTTPYMNGKCIAIPTDEELEENAVPTDPEDTGEDVTDPEDYVEPDVEEYRGSTVEESGGCSTSPGGERSAWPACSRCSRRHVIEAGGRR